MVRFDRINRKGKKRRKQAGADKVKRIRRPPYVCSYPFRKKRPATGFHKEARKFGRNLRIIFEMPTTFLPFSMTFRQSTARTDTLPDRTDTSTARADTLLDRTDTPPDRPNTLPDRTDTSIAQTDTPTAPTTPFIAPTTPSIARTGTLPDRPDTPPDRQPIHSPDRPTHRPD